MIPQPSKSSSNPICEHCGEEGRLLHNGIHECRNHNCINFPYFTPGNAVAWEKILGRPMRMDGDPNSIIFVFGSNLAGIHGAGAALDAVNHWGAIYGLGIGRQGNSYAIPTKNHRLGTRPLNYIEYDVKQFLAYAWAHPELEFQVTRIGCGYAGYTDKDIAPMFKEATPNVHLPLGWREWDSKTT